MTQTVAKRVIFLPFIDAFGGVERLGLDLSRFLYEAEVPHTLACFRQTIDLQAYAAWPVPVHELRPARAPLAEARSLSQFLGTEQQKGSGLPLLFDLKSAFYSGITSAGRFVLHLTDPPSLLPADVSKYSFSARRDFAEFAPLPRSGIATALRSESVHRLTRRGVRRAAKVIVMTERIRDEVSGLYGVDPLVVRPGVVSPIRLKPEPLGSLGKGPLRILSVSRLEASKRLDWILRALAALNSTAGWQKTDWVFEIVGQGPAGESLRTMARELGVADQTLFLGHVSDEDLGGAYERAQLFIMPAQQGYGLPALEALERGIPTIVHKDSGVSEILARTPWAELVDGDNGSLATAIANMNDRIKGQRLFDSDRPAVPTSFAWATAVCHACGWTEASMRIQGVDGPPTAS